jgi:small ligand-binding sensory domain FIST
MRWASALSTDPDLAKACAECAQFLERSLERKAPDLLLVFPSREHVLQQGRIPEFLADRFPKAVLMGCTAGGVIGGGREVEDHCALSLIAGHMPGVQMHPFRIEKGPLPSLDESPRTWKNAIGLQEAPENLHFILLADPFSTSPDTLLKGLDYAYPNTAKLGGLASAAASPDGNALYFGDRVYSNGAVGIAIWGDVRIDPVVAQGGTPIGKPVQITRCDRYALYELDGRPALEVFQEAVEELEVEITKEHAGAFVLGIQADGLVESPGAGDFLIRNVLGIDPKANAVAIAESLEVGQTVQFHLVGAESAALELRQLLVRYRERESAAPAAALLFSCNGRGMNLYGSPDHDSSLFHEIVGREVPLAGFFCAGEIGPVGGQTYVHGMTSSFGIIRPASSQNPARRTAEAAQQLLIPRETRRG